MRLPVSQAEISGVVQVMIVNFKILNQMRSCARLVATTIKKCDAWGARSLVVLRDPVPTVDWI